MLMAKTKNLVLIVGMLLPISVIQAEDRSAKQKELDQVCEAARERKLQPEREHYIQECQDKQHRDKEYCERFYSDWGSRTGDRTPLYYDLPECVRAFDYRNSYRNPG